MSDLTTGTPNLENAPWDIGPRERNAYALFLKRLGVITAGERARIVAASRFAEIEDVVRAVEERMSPETP